MCKLSERNIHACSHLGWEKCRTLNVKTVCVQTGFEFESTPRAVMGFHCGETLIKNYVAIVNNELKCNIFLNDISEVEIFTYVLKA